MARMPVGAVLEEVSKDGVRYWLVEDVEPDGYAQTLECDKDGEVVSRMKHWFSEEYVGNLRMVGHRERA